MKANEQLAETLIEDDRYDDYAENRDESSISEYEITAAPTDFNVMTLKNFVDRKWLRIPGFQRHYVWDLPRASKLIESLILGLPVPQIFLYERERNNNLLIDGQQRLMSIYYFLNERFPRADRRKEIRLIYDEENHIPSEIFQNDEYFRNFKLLLPESDSGKKNRLTGLTYSTLGETNQSRLDMRPVRCFFIRQNALSDDDSAVYEIFNRLNTGGVTLHPQEIRVSMHQSGFYEMLNKINLLPRWREMVSSSVPDLHMKDMEILLRGFAMLIEGKNYKPSMVKFLNRFSRACKDQEPETNQYLEELFLSFLKAARDLPLDIFINKSNNRFNIALYEAVFTSSCRKAYSRRRMVRKKLNAERIEMLRTDRRFLEASQKGTTNPSNVEIRLRRANQILKSKEV